MSERAILTDLESGSLKHCKFIVSLFHELTVESRFLEPPGETQIGSRNREFAKSKVASNYA